MKTLRNKNRYIRLRAPFIISLVGFSFLLQCSSTPDSAPDKVEPGIKFKISCANEQATRHHYSPTTGEIAERGPVLLTKGMTCNDASKLDEKEMLKLQRDGEWIGYYAGNAKVLWRGLFKKNKREGDVKYFDQGGKVTKVVAYQDGQQEGREEGYFGDGSIRYKGQNSKGMKTGNWEEYSSVKRECTTQGSYNQDEKTGTWQECSQDEDEKWYISFKGSYKQGLKDGAAESFHPNGTISGKGSYRADLTCKENPPSEGVEACGRRTGKWQIYYPSEKLAMEGSYDGMTGKRTGNWTEYYASGEKMAMGPRNHTRNGLWTFYNKNGQILGQYGFKGNDFMASQCVLYENGTKKEEGGCTNVLVQYKADKDAMQIGNIMRAGQWTGYYSNGKKAWEGQFMMKLKVEQWAYYNEAGALTAKGKYNMDKKTGIWQETENGRLVTVEYDAFGRPVKK